jgi:hypothetical protein
LHHDRPGRIDLLDDGLAAAIDAVLQPERGVRHLPRHALRRHHLHAAGFGAGVAQRHPRGDMLVRVETEIGRVLVPGGEGRAVRFLDEEDRGVDQDVEADHILDDIENALVPDQRIKPRQEHVCR